MATRQGTGTRDYKGEGEGFSWKALLIVASVGAVTLMVGMFIGTMFDAGTMTVSIPLPNLTPR